MVELVAAGGYDTVTVRKLTKLAGVSNGAFYAQFDGIGDCFIDTYAVLMERTRCEVIASRSPSLGRRRQVASSLYALLGDVVTDRKAARLSLIEFPAGGPAALAALKDHEARLEGALKQSLDRRGKVVSPTTVAWLAAGTTHCARTCLTLNLNERESRFLTTVVGWAHAVVDAPQRPSAAASKPPSERVKWRDHRVRESTSMDGFLASGSEFAAILSALKRLSMHESYWNLSIQRVSKAAGVPITHFKRHFSGLEDGYLALARQISLSLFEPITSPSGPMPDEVSVSSRVGGFIARVADNPTIARLALIGLLEVGRAGFTCRQALISDFATSLCQSLPATTRPHPIAAEATLAGLWTVVARAIEGGEPRLLQGTSRALADLFRLSLDQPRTGTTARP